MFFSNHKKGMLSSFVSKKKKKYKGEKKRNPWGLKKYGEGAERASHSLGGLFMDKYIREGKKKGQNQLRPNVRQVPN